MAEHSKFSGALAKLNQRPGGNNDKGEEGQTLVAVPSLGQDEGDQPTATRGKRSNPTFERTTVYLGKTTKKNANRKLEDIDSNMDLSDLIELLLQGWIAEKQMSSGSDV